MLLPLLLNLQRTETQWVRGAGGVSAQISEPLPKVDRAIARVERIKKKVYKAQEKKNVESLSSLMIQLALAERALWLLTRESPQIASYVQKKQTGEIDDIMVIAIFHD